MADLPVRELKMFHNAVYGTVDLGHMKDRTRVSVTVKVPISREDVKGALEPIQAVLRKEAEKAIQESAIDGQMSDARSNAQKELAQRIVAQISRGALPDEIAKGLKPIAGRQ